MTTKRATLSADGLYRYRLERDIDQGLDEDLNDGPIKPLTVIMINPSTADASVDDATIRRLIGFAKNMGSEKLIVANLFALRSPLVTDLAKHADPVGPENWRHLSKIMEESKNGHVVVAFGAYSKIPKLHMDCVDKLRDLADIHGVTLWCWGTNKDGSPKHPLYISATKALEPWL
jgi:hypothetical protein